MRSRNEFLDVTKGVLIFLVVLGHVIQLSHIDGSFYESPLFILIYSFHMPLFIGLSGFFFYFSIDKDKCAETVKSRFSSLIPILVFWTVFYQVSKYLCIGAFSFESIVETLRLIPRIYWYIPILLACMLFVLIHLTLFKRNNMIAFLAFVAILLLPDWSILKYFKYLFPFFLLGIVVNKHQLKILKYSKVISLICFITFLSLLYYWKTDFYIYTTGMGLIDYKNLSINVNVVNASIFRYVAGIVGSVSFLLLIKYLSKFVPNKFLTEVGKETLGIYMLHIVILQILSCLYQVPASVSYSLFITIGTLIFCFYFIRFLKRRFSFVQFIFG